MQTLYGETHANAKICTALKVNPNATARSLAVDKLLAEEQIEGLSYRGAGKLIQQSNHLKIAPGTIHDYVSQTGAFIRKTADEERSAIFKASDYTEEGFLENIQEAQQRFGIIKLKAHPLATELAKVLGMFNTKLEADWLQMPKAKRPLQPQRVSSIAFLPTLECWDGKLPLAYICVDEVMVKKQKTMRKRSRKPQHQDRPGVSTTSITVKWDGKLQLLIASSVKDGFKTLIAFLLHNGLINRHMVFFIDGAGVLKTQIDKYFSYCSYQINLDWYHVTEQIDSMIGRGTAGSHEERRAYRDAVKKALWYFNYNDALQYIDKLIAEHSTKERSVILQSAKNYINNKVTLFSCYAMRKYLGLPNSSNTIERYNGLTVSNRQKHRGCSWSNLGSNSQTLLSSTNLNKELDKLLKSANYEDYTIDLFKAA